MDGVGSEMVESEPEASEGPQPADMKIPSPSFAALHVRAGKRWAPSAGNESIPSTTNSQRRNVGNASPPTNDENQSIMYPTRVYLRHNEPINREQSARPYSTGVPRGPRQSESDVETIKQGSRSQWPRPYIRLPITLKKLTEDEAADGSMPGMNRSGTH